MQSHSLSNELPKSARSSFWIWAVEVNLDLRFCKRGGVPNCAAVDLPSEVVSIGISVFSKFN